YGDWSSDVCSSDLRGNGHSFHRLVEVGIRIDNDRVLAAHFGDDALDPDLSRLMPGGQLVNPQPDVARAREGDEACLRMLDEQIANRRSAPRQQRERALRESG